MPLLRVPIENRGKHCPICVQFAIELLKWLLFLALKQAPIFVNPSCYAPAGLEKVGPMSRGERFVGVKKQVPDICARHIDVRAQLLEGPLAFHIGLSNLFLPDLYLIEK